MQINHSRASIVDNKQRNAWKKHYYSGAAQVKTPRIVPALNLLF